MGAGHEDTTTKRIKVKPINFILKSHMNIKYAPV